MPERARQLILDAARDQVVDFGLESLSVRSVARRAHYSPAGLYRHFESIEALRHALREQVSKELGEYVAQDLRSADVPDAPATGRSVATWVDDNREIAELVLSDDAVMSTIVEVEELWTTLTLKDLPLEQRQSVATLSWDIHRSILRMRQTHPGVDHEALYVAATEFVAQAARDGLF